MIKTEFIYANSGHNLDDALSQAEKRLHAYLSHESYTSLTVDHNIFTSSVDGQLKYHVTILVVLHN